MSTKNPILRLFLPRYMVREEKKIKNDFETGSMYKNFIKIAWPSVLEAFLIGIISFVDTLMVSSCGDAAVAAVGLTAQPRLIFFGLISGLTIGVNAVVARRKGEGKLTDANRVLSESLWLILLVAISFFALAVVIADPLLRLAGAQDDTIVEATLYFRIIMLGMIFTSITMTLNAAQRACGNTRTSMTTNVVANIVNVVFNALLINGLLFFPQLGVRGAAIATVLGNFASACMAIILCKRRGNDLHLRFREVIRFQSTHLRPVFKVASGTCLEQLVMRIGFFLFAKIVAELGTKEFAAHNIAMTILTLTFTLGDGLSIAATSLVGQNLGKRRPDHSLVYGKIAQRVSWIFALAFILLLFTFRHVIMSLFSSDPWINETGSLLIVLVIFVCIAQIQQVIFSGCLRGAGDTRYMAVISFCSIAIARPLIAFLLVYTAGLGVIGAWIAIIVDQYARFFFSAHRFYGQKWCKVEL